MHKYIVIFTMNGNVAYASIEADNEQQAVTLSMRKGVDNVVVVYQLW